MAKDAEAKAAQAERIRGLRAQARISQLTAALGIGVSPRRYQQWEAGETVGGENLRKLAEYYGTTPDYIEYGTLARTKGETPDPLAALTPDRLTQLGEQLDRIETQLADLADRLTDGTAPVGQLVDQISRAVLETLRQQLSQQASLPAPSHERDPRREPPPAATGDR